MLRISIVCSKVFYQIKNTQRMCAKGRLIEWNIQRSITLPAPFDFAGETPKRKKKKTSRIGTNTKIRDREWKLTVWTFAEESGHIVRHTRNTYKSKNKTNETMSVRVMILMHYDTHTRTQWHQWSATLMTSKWEMRQTNGAYAREGKHNNNRITVLKKPSWKHEERTTRPDRRLNGNRGERRKKIT